MGIMTLEQVRPALAPHEDALRAAVVRAFARWQRGVARKFARPTPRTRASAMHDLMIEEALRAFDGVPSVTLVSARGRRMLRFGATIVPHPILVQFKKLDDRGRPNNYPTQLALAFDRQLPILGFPDDVRVTIGYRLTSSGLEIVGVFMLCMSGKHPAWMYEITDEAPSATVIPLPTAPTQPKQPTRRLRPKDGAVVVPIRKASGKGNGDDNGGDGPSKL